MQIPTEHIKIFSQKFNSRYTISQLIELLEDLKLGREQEWFRKLKTIFTEVLEDTPDTLPYLIGFLNTGQLSALAFPRIFHLIKVFSIFLIQTLEYLGIERLSEMKSANTDVLILYKRILSTLIAACARLLSVNSRCILNRGEWSSVKITSADAKIMNQSLDGKLIDYGVWNEFMDFLETRENLMRPPTETCIMM